MMLDDLVSWVIPIFHGTAAVEGWPPPWASRSRLRSARGRCGLKHPVNNPRLGKRPVMKDRHDEQSATHDLTNTRWWPGGASGSSNHGSTRNTGWVGNPTYTRTRGETYLEN